MSRERLTSQEPNVVIAKELISIAQLVADQNDKAMKNWPVADKEKVAEEKEEKPVEATLKEEVDEEGKTAASEVPQDDTKVEGKTEEKKEVKADQNDDAMKNNPVPDPVKVLEKDEKVNTASEKTAEDQNAKAMKNWPVADKDKVAATLVAFAKQLIAEDQNEKAMKNWPVADKEKVAATLVKLAKLMIAEKAATPKIKARLEYLRKEINNERISQGEILELENLADYIDPDDVQLLEWAGVEEKG